MKNHTLEIGQSMGSELFSIWTRIGCVFVPQMMLRPHIAPSSYPETRTMKSMKNLNLPS